MPVWKIHESINTYCPHIPFEKPHPGRRSQRACLAPCDSRLPPPCRLAPPACSDRGSKLPWYRCIPVQMACWCATPRPGNRGGGGGGGGEGEGGEEREREREREREPETEAQIKTIVSKMTIKIKPCFPRREPGPELGSSALWKCSTLHWRCKTRHARPPAPATGSTPARSVSAQAVGCLVVKASTSRTGNRESWQINVEALRITPLSVRMGNTAS